MNNKKLKTVVLDWATISDNDDISPEEIFSSGEIKFYSLTSAEQTAEHIGDSDIVLCNKVIIDEDIIKKCPDIKYIGLFATGFNNIDLKAADKYSIPVCNAGEYSTDAVAQHTFALILQHYSKISLYKNAVDNGDWMNSKTFSVFPYPMHELAGKTLSIVGYGSIGKAVAKIAAAFNMNIIISTRTRPENCPYELVSVDEAFSRADIITFHCPLTEQTAKMINKDRIALMKPNALIINTSRGGVADEEALAEALNNGKIGGAGLDVLATEPMKKDSPLYKAKNCIITPHVAWAPLETRKRLINIVNNNIKAWLNNSPEHVVNHPSK